MKEESKILDTVATFGCEEKMNLRMSPAHTIFYLLCYMVTQIIRYTQSLHHCMTFLRLQHTLCLYIRWFNLPACTSYPLLKVSPPRFQDAQLQFSPQTQLSFSQYHNSSNHFPSSIDQIATTLHSGLADSFSLPGCLRMRRGRRPLPRQSTPLYASHVSLPLSHAKWILGKQCRWRMREGK